MLIMKKKQQTSTRQMRMTSFFGYGLFSILLLAVIVSTIIPFGTLMTNPAVKHFNVAITIVALTASAVLPALVSYFLGDRATHTKNRDVHHYNGVLLAIAAYWLWQLLSILENPLSTITNSVPIYLTSIVNAWPMFATLLVISLVSISYTLHQKGRKTLLQHPPYQLVLLGAVVTTLVHVATYQNYATSESFWQTTLPLVLPITLTLMSYSLLAKNESSQLVRLSGAVVAMSIGVFVGSFSGLLIPEIPVSYTFTLLLTQLIGVIVWIVYLWMQLRSERK